MSRPFADVLRELSGGETYDELTTRLGGLVTAVMETRRRGTLSINLTVKPNGDAGVIVTDEIKSKLPEKNCGETVFFVTGGSLIRNDPRQQDLPLRRVGETA